MSQLFDNSINTSVVTTKISINQYIDHTILKPTLTIKDIEKICNEAILYKFIAVCIPPHYINDARRLLLTSNVKVATVISFPFGYSSINTKLTEIQDAIHDNVDEIDVVANISAIKSHDWNYLQKEIDSIMEIINKYNKTIKVIIESGVLTDEEIIECCQIYSKAKIHYLKTSTGYADKGASIHAIKLFRSYLSKDVNIKASGGIRDYNTLLSMIEAGANRIGCSSGADIMNENISIQPINDTNTMTSY